MIASRRGSRPSSSGAEMGKTFAPVAFSSALAVFERGPASVRSDLVSAMSSGLSARPAP